MLCGSQDGKGGGWERVNTCTCMAESLRCSPETFTTLLISYMSIQNKKYFFLSQEKDKMSLLTLSPNATKIGESDKRYSEKTGFSIFH